MKRNKVQNTQNIMDKPAHPHVDTPSEMYLYACVFHRFLLGLSPSRRFAHCCIPRAQKNAWHLVCLQYLFFE